jgi:hypothetical protein
MACSRMMLVGIVCLLMAGCTGAATELSVKMGLGEIKWRTMRERNLRPMACNRRGHGMNS